MPRSPPLQPLLLALALAAPPAAATTWQDAAFRYWFGTAFAEPGIAANVQKQALAFTHLSGYAHGGKFLNVDLRYSSPADPVNSATSTPIHQGALEVYVTWRHQVSLNSFFPSRPLEAGPLRDLDLYFGADLSVKNTAFAPEKIMPLAGLDASFRVPGVLTVGVALGREYNTNGIAGRAVRFDPALQFNAVWNLKLVAALTLEGFANVLLPRGKNGFGAETVTEVILRPKLLYDVGTLFGEKGWQVGFGWQYWLNKFGNDHDKVIGSAESALFVELAVHL